MAKIVGYKGCYTGNPENPREYSCETTISDLNWGEMDGLRQTVQDAEAMAKVVMLIIEFFAEGEHGNLTLEQICATFSQEEKDEIIEAIKWELDEKAREKLDMI